LAPGVESSEDISPLHNAAAAAAAIDQASASRPSPRPPSARAGAVYVGSTEINNSEWTLQTQEEPDMEQGFEKIIIPIAAEVVLGEVVFPDHESENNEAISEAQIETAETAKLCGQPRWLIFTLLGVLVSVAIGAGVGIALSLEPSDSPLPTSAPTSERRNDVEKIISSEIPSFQLGPSQIEALNWLADDDLANLNFELVTPTELLERFVLALLYFSTGGENWADKTGSDISGFFSAMSVCSWNGVGCDPTVFETYPMVVQLRFDNDNLRGQLPTELGLLTSLQLLRLGKFTTMTSSELDTITLLRPLSYNKLSPLRLL
jgi:hypothetical protein